MSRVFTDPMVQAANDAGCIFYSDPATLTPGMIDPLLRDAVAKINASGWVWTAESCQGHPDFGLVDVHTAWEHNTRPMLRLVCRADHAGSMLVALTRSACDPITDVLTPIEEETDLRLSRYPQGLELWPNERRNGWYEVLAYFQAGNVAMRDLGCLRFARFAALVCKEKP